MSRIAPYAPRIVGRRPTPAPREPVLHEHSARSPEPVFQGRRAVVVEPHVRSRTAIEHALLGEGYGLVDGEFSGTPVLLFAGARDGLHVLEARDVAAVLEGLSGGPGGLHGPPLAPGIHAFVPRPFGIADVLRVARAVDGFDCRRRTPEA